MGFASSCPILMHYLYDDPRIMYPQLMMAAHKADSEQEDWPQEGVQVRTVQSEGKGDIAGLSEQIMQLQVAVQGPQRTKTSSPPRLGRCKER